MSDTEVASVTGGEMKAWQRVFPASRCLRCAGENHCRRGLASPEGDGESEFVCRYPWGLGDAVFFPGLAGPALGKHERRSQLGLPKTWAKY